MPEDTSHRPEIMTGRAWRPCTAPALVIAWWCLLAIANARWVERHVLALPPPWDPALQQLVGLRVFQAFQETGWGAAWNEMHARSPFGPVLFPLSSIPLYWAFGTTRAVAHFTTSLYLLLHLAAVFLFARRLRGDRTALLAVFLFSTFGAAINLSRDYLHDFPAAAFVALALLALAGSEGLSHLRSAAAFGLCAGLAAVTKSMAPFFIVGPLLYVLAIRARRGLWPRAAAVSLAALAFAVVTIPWWGRHAGSAVWYLWHYGMGAGASAFAPAGDRLLSVRNVTYYAVALVNEGTSLQLALVAVVAGLIRLRRPQTDQSSSSTRRLLEVWLVTGYLLLTLSFNKAPDRYTIFLLTPIAVLLAAGIAGMRHGRALAAGAALAGIWTWMAWTLDGPWTPPVVFYRPPVSLQAFSPRHVWIRSMQGIPDGKWPVAETVQRLAALTPALKERSSAEYASRHATRAEPEQQVRAAFLALLAREPDLGALRAYSQQFEAARPAEEFLREIVSSEEFRRRPLRVAVAPDEPLINAATLNYYAAFQRATVSFLALPNTPGPPWTPAFEAIVVAEKNNSQMSVLRRRLSSHGSGYERIFAFRCPDERTLEVFALNGPVDRGPAKP